MLLWLADELFCEAELLLACSFSSVDEALEESCVLSSEEAESAELVSSEELLGSLIELRESSELETTEELEAGIELEETEVLAFPSDECVAVLTTTLVAPRASTAEKIANGVIKGAVLLDIFAPPFSFAMIIFHGNLLV